MRLHSLIGRLGGLVLGLSVAAAQAAVFVEVGDAGQQLAAAQLVPAGTTQITGNLPLGVAADLSFVPDVDLFQFTWGGGGFAADTVGSLLRDPMLWLFDALGRGIQANDDAIAPLQAALSVPNLAAGTYLIAISPFYTEPTSASGPMFPLPSTELLDPIDPSATLASWTNQFFEFQDPDAAAYVVNLAQVPEPGALALLVGGLLGLRGLRRRA